MPTLGYDELLPDPGIMHLRARSVSVERISRSMARASSVSYRADSRASPWRTTANGVSRGGSSVSAARAFHGMTGAHQKAHYERQEQIVSAALAERWPDPERRQALDLVAMVGIGTLRLAMKTWGAAEARGSLAEPMDRAFIALHSKMTK